MIHGYSRVTILLDQNMARSSHYMQSVVRSSQSVVRSPSFILRDLKRSTLRGVMLQGYNKSVLPVRNIQLISLKTSRPWYRQALDCRWLNISSKDSSTKTRNTRSLKDERHLVCSRATSGVTLPFHNRYFWSVGHFVFINTKIKKRFLFCISPAVTPFLAEFVTHELLC